MSDEFSAVDVMTVPDILHLFTSIERVAGIAEMAQKYLFIYGGVNTGMDLSE